MQISLVGAGYWGSKLQKELQTIGDVDDVEIIDIKDGKTLKDINRVLKKNGKLSVVESGKTKINCRFYNMVDPLYTLPY